MSASAVSCQWTRLFESPSSQGYTSFEGHELTGRVTDVWLRGQRILDAGNVVGPARGEYQPRGPGSTRV